MDKRKITEDDIKRIRKIRRESYHRRKLINKEKLKAQRAKYYSKVKKSPERYKKLITCILLKRKFNKTKDILPGGINWNLKT